MVALSSFAEFALHLKFHTEPLDVVVRQNHVCQTLECTKNIQWTINQERRQACQTTAQIITSLQSVFNGLRPRVVGLISRSALQMLRFTYIK